MARVTTQPIVMRDQAKFRHRGTTAQTVLRQFQRVLTTEFPDEGKRPYFDVFNSDGECSVVIDQPYAPRAIKALEAAFDKKAA